MPYRMRTGCLVALAAALLPPPTAAPQVRRSAITDVTVVDVTTGAVLPPRRVVMISGAGRGRPIARAVPRPGSG